MTKTHCLLIISVLLVASGCERSVLTHTAGTTTKTHNVESIVDIFKKGLQTNKENNPDLPDADLFGAALISIAWERFAENPDAAPAMFAAFEQFVSQSELSVRYQQWDTFLENLESALLHSKDAEHLRKNWQVRQKVIESQQKALQDWGKGVVTRLDAYANSLSELKNPAEIQPFERQNEIEVLFDLFASDEVAENVRKPLTDKANEIAKIIDGKLSQSVVRFEQEIETERKKDLPGSDEQFQPVKESETEGRTVWKKGKYQELLECLLPLVALQDNPTIAFWSDYRNEEDTEDNFMQRLVIAYQEATRLQKIRYNLWVVRVLSSNSTITYLSHIDTGLLEPSVGALYSQRENELITQQPDRRANEIRRILLQNKVTLEAF